MARIRTIKPEFWLDEAIAGLSRDARLLFIATFNMADDEGLLRWTPAYVKSQAFIYDDDITVEVAERLMGELESAGLVFAYHGGTIRQRLAFIVNFRKHQKINRPQPSRLPAPSIQNRTVQEMYARRDGWQCHQCGGPIREQDHDLSISSEGASDYPGNVHASHETCPKPATSQNATHDDPMNDSVNDASLFTESFTAGTGNREQGKGTTPSRGARSETPGFEAFWEVYPRRVGKDAARKAWDKAIKTVSAEDVLAGAKRYAELRRGRDPAFTAHPSTWLNQGRWQDEPDATSGEDWRKYSEQ